MVFPFDFGFFPGTRAEDGDPLDVLVLCEEPTSRSTLNWDAVRPHLGRSGIPADAKTSSAHSQAACLAVEFTCFEIEVNFLSASFSSSSVSSSNAATSERSNVFAKSRAEP
jgi:Inorganic pyrophosphatase